ncbi:hypothetical protein F511_43312 [Dorcoceras hygrometricum]|uniref:Dystroglycan-like n=1 Tax=Dorcoceras hygrometricum TaxID=472368 RepID=A0A2Z7CRW3_9LAMI|nr:hypothetical protein F511_43312 [Dorcoceras hygrometricum]
MASSLYSNAQHVDFESVLGMDDPGMVSMFEALMASGLRGFLGYPAIVYEDALIDFFENASVRSGVVISTVGGQLVEISEKLFAESFELPVDAVPKKKRSLKKKSISSLELVEVAEEALVVEPLDVEEPRCSSADAVDLIIQQVLDETRAADAPADTSEPAVSEEKHWFDLPYDDIVKQWEAERPVVTASDTEDEIATDDVAPADEVQQVQDFEAPISAEDVLSADEKMSLDDILLSIPVDIPLPSTCMEVTQIKMGQMIKIPGVTEKTWFLNSLPRIPADDKGKEILVEKDPVKGNPAKEHYSLICADIDLLVSLRAKVIDEVATFFNSFSLKKLASINIEEMYRKEEQVLSWGETESPQEAIQRKFYILLKYRTILVWKFLEAWRVNFAPGQGSSAVDIQVIELLSDLYLYFLEELAKEERNLGLTWTKPSCSKILEGSPRDRGAVIARSNSNTRSLCWIRRMLLIDGLWAVEFCADRWSDISSRLHKLEQSVCDSLRDQADIFKNLVQGARQEVRTLDDVHTIRFNEFRKTVLSQNASIFQGLADVRQVVDAVNAKVDIMAKRLSDIQKDAEATKEALSHQLLEFQSSAQENHNVIHAQLSELVDYIHRGSADKKGESGSRGLQKPANTQKQGSVVTPSFEQRVQMAQRRIVHTVLDADANR